MSKLLTPACPRCKTPPYMAVSPQQAFCGNEDCEGYTWDMTKTAEENEAGVSYHCGVCGRQLQAGDSVCVCQRPDETQPRRPGLSPMERTGIYLGERRDV